MVGEGTATNTPSPAAARTRKQGREPRIPSAWAARVAHGEDAAAAWMWWLGGGYETARLRSSRPKTLHVLYWWLSVSPLWVVFAGEDTASHQPGV